MKHLKEFITTFDTSAIIEDNGTSRDFGRLRTYETESGLKFAADLVYYGDLVEAFALESMSKASFDGDINVLLRIEVGDEGDNGFMVIWVCDNDTVDRLCRTLGIATGLKVIVYCDDFELVNYYCGENTADSKTIVHYVPDADDELIANTSWPRDTIDFERACAILSECTKDELRDHAFGDREITWYNKYDQTVASGYSGRDGREVTFCGFDAYFEGSDASVLIDLGSLADVERNDSTGPDEFEDGNVMPGLTNEGVLNELTR